MTNDAVVLVDCQNDFCTRRGSLFVTGAVDDMLRLKGVFSSLDKVVDIYMTADKHPYNTTYNAGSFASQKDAWPQHCVEGTWGACFDADLYRAVLNYANKFEQPHPIIWYKGGCSSVDSYSVFSDNQYLVRTSTSTLKHQCLSNYKRVFWAGEALDYCVYQSIMDYLMLDFLCEREDRLQSHMSNFNRDNLVQEMLLARYRVRRDVFVIEDCTSFIDEKHANEQQKELTKFGVKYIDSKAMLTLINK